MPRKPVKRSKAAGSLNSSTMNTKTNSSSSPVNSLKTDKSVAMDPFSDENMQWISGSDMMFRTPKDPSPAVTRRRTTMMAHEFKVPSFMIASPPGVKTRSRRSSLYIASQENIHQSRSEAPGGVQLQKSRNVKRAGKNDKKKSETRVTPAKVVKSYSAGVNDKENNEFLRLSNLGKSRKEVDDNKSDVKLPLSDMTTLPFECALKPDSSSKESKIAAEDSAKDSHTPLTRQTKRFVAHENVTVVNEYDGSGLEQASILSKEKVSAFIAEDFSLPQNLCTPRRSVRILSNMDVATKECVSAISSGKTNTVLMESESANSVSNNVVGSNNSVLIKDGTNLSVTPMTQKSSQSSVSKSCQNKEQVAQQKRSSKITRRSQTPDRKFLTASPSRKGLSHLNSELSTKSLYFPYNTNSPRRTLRSDSTSTQGSTPSRAAFKAKKILGIDTQNHDPPHFTMIQNKTVESERTDDLEILQISENNSSFSEANVSFTYTTLSQRCTIL